MDSTKDPKETIITTHRGASESTDPHIDSSKIKQPSVASSHEHHHHHHHDQHPQPEPQPPHHRPGADIMASTDPSTAAIRAWALNRQTQLPGSDGSFAAGGDSVSGGFVASSGGPLLLPRKEFIVDPPMHSVDHGRAEVVGGKEGVGEGEGHGGDGKGHEEKKRRGSWRELFEGQKK